jgi:hypothetical protein
VQPRGRTFTLEEATALLPTVDRLLAEAQALAERLRAAEEAAQAEQWKLRANGHVRVAQSGAGGGAAQRRALAEQLARLIDRIQSMGVVVRDVRQGLIDFPSPREGRIVYLCWQRGEPLEIRWWHEIEAGITGRQPL